MARPFRCESLSSKCHQYIYRYCGKQRMIDIMLRISLFIFLQNQGIDIADSELLDYISESSTMSKSLADYGEQKSCAVTTARRLAHFLGDTMVKDKGLHCQYIVACEPQVPVLRPVIILLHAHSRL